MEESGRVSAFPESSPPIYSFLMKYATLKAFESHLEEAVLYPLYLIIGKEPFERKLAVDRLITEALKKASSPDLALKVYEGDRVSLEELMQELNTLGFFAEKRVILIQNADKLSKALMDQLENYYQNPNPSVCLVISAAAINKATNFYKKGEKAGAALEFAEEKPWEKEKSLQGWVQSLAAAENKKMDSQAAAALVKQVGTDQSLLFQEVQKLVCYISSRPDITARDIAAVCTQTHSENAWQLGEAIFKRDAPAALRISKGLMEEGTAVFSLLRQIRTQMQTEYQICSLLATGATPAVISEKFPYMRGRILDNHIQMAQNYGLTRFKKAMLKIDEMELLAKNSSIDPDVLAELLIVKLVT